MMFGSSNFINDNIGVGAIIQNSNEQVVAALAKKGERQAYSFYIKSLVPSEGLWLIGRHSSSLLMVESDVNQVVVAILAEQPFRSDAWANFTSIRSALARFEAWQFRSCFRENNQIAHILAQHLHESNMAI